MCSVPKEFTDSIKIKLLLSDREDWYTMANSMPGIVVGIERWYEPKCYPCVMIEVTISGITRFDFVYKSDFGM